LETQIGNYKQTSTLLNSYLVLKTSSSFRNAEFIRIENGYFSKSLGKQIMASQSVTLKICE
jgi:hypothetical protein